LAKNVEFQREKRKKLREYLLSERRVIECARNPEAHTHQKSPHHPLLSPAKCLKIFVKACQRKPHQGSLLNTENIGSLQHPNVPVNRFVGSWLTRERVKGVKQEKVTQ
jgi:hypothetical protein